MACLFGHKWDGCKCEHCGKVRDEQHNWDLCNGICRRCGKTQAEHHIWKLVPGEHLERCSRCGRERVSEHGNRLKNKTLDEDFLISEVDKILSNRKNYLRHSELWDLIKERKDTMPRLAAKIIEASINDKINNAPDSIVHFEPRFIIKNCNAMGLSWAKLCHVATLRALLEYIIKYYHRFDEQYEIPSVIEQIYHEQPELRDYILGHNGVKMQDASKERTYSFIGEPDIGIPGKPEQYLCIKKSTENSIMVSFTTANNVERE